MGTYPAISYATHDREDIDTFSQAVSAPGPFMEFGEFLRLEATSTDASATLRLNGKFLSTDGEIRFFTEDMVITGTGTQTAVTSRLGPCWLMGFSVRVVAGTITDGEVVASVHVARDAPTAPIHVMTLASGEITNTRALGMGGYVIRGPSSVALSQPTITRVATTATAGNELQWVVPANTVYEILSFRAQLVTSATVSTRRVGIVAFDGTGTFYDGYGDLTQAASLTRLYSGAANTEYFQTIANTIIPVKTPQIMLAAGATLATNTQNLQAGDQWSNAHLLVRVY